LYCGNDCNGNPFCGEASKKIGVESSYPAAFSETDPDIYRQDVFAAQIISILNAVKSSAFQKEIT
jgi:hypothetical protein